MRSSLNTIWSFGSITWFPIPNTRFKENRFHDLLATSFTKFVSKVTSFIQEDEVHCLRSHTSSLLKLVLLYKRASWSERWIFQTFLLNFIDRKLLLFQWWFFHDSLKEKSRLYKPCNQAFSFEFSNVRTSTTLEHTKARLLFVYSPKQPTSSGECDAQFVSEWVRISLKISLKLGDIVSDIRFDDASQMMLLGRSTMRSRHHL